MQLRVEFVLEDVQVVGGGDGDDVLSRVPGCVEDLLGEVQAVHADVVLPALSPGGTHPPWLQDRSGFAALPRRLQGHVPFGVAVEHAEKVVVGSSHDHTVRAVPGALKLVKDAVVFIQGAQFTAEVFMDLIRLHWPVLHVEVPDFDGEVVPCHHVASAVTELHVRDGGDDLREKRSAAWILWLLKEL